MALDDPNAPWSWVPPEWLAFGDEQVPNIFGDVNVNGGVPIMPVPAPTPLDAPLTPPRGSNPSPGAPAPLPPPAPPQPPGPTEPTYPGPRPAPQYVEPPVFQPFGPNEDEKPKIERADIPLGDAPPEVEMPPAEGRLPEDTRAQLAEAPPWLRDVFGITDEDRAREEKLRTAEYLSGPEGTLKFRQDLQTREDEFARRAQDPALAAVKRQADIEAKHAEVMRKANEESTAILAESKALAADPGWFARQGTGTKIVGYIMAALSGFMNPTGTNSALELIKAQNEGDFNRRRAGLAERRAALQGTVEQAGSVREAGHQELIATYESAIKAIEADMQKFDPLGARAQKAAALIGGLQAEIAKAAEAAHKESVDEAIKGAEYDYKVAQTEKARAEAAKLRGAGTGGSGGLVPTGIAGQGGRKDALTSDQWAARGIALPPPPRESGWTEKELKTWQQQTRADQELSQNVFGGLKQPDTGAPFVATGDDAAVNKAKENYLGMKAVVSAIDAMARNYTGLTSDTFASDENQNIRTQWQRARVYLGKTFQLGALAEEDLKIVDGYLTSGLNPTGFRNVLTSLLSARGSIIEDTNNALQLAGYKGDLRKEIPPMPKDTGRFQSADEKAFANIIKVGDPKVIGPLTKRLKGIVIDGVADADINRDAAITMLRSIKKRGGKFKGYAADVLGLADIPRYKASEKESDEAHQRLGGGAPTAREPDPDADFFESTPDDDEARFIRDIADFEQEQGL